MKLNEYMPPFLKDVREFKEIFATEDKELEYMNNLIASMLTEVIVKTANSYGLTRYEKIYEITDIASTVEARRTNILLKINNRVPYTKKWLVNLLDAVIGKDAYTLKIDESNYLINIETTLNYSEAMETLKKELALEIPANMKLNYDLVTNMKLNIAAIITQQHDNLKISSGIADIEEKIQLNASNYVAVKINIDDYIKI